ncbi:hypothetical protein MBRA_17080 [Mycobacterium branderi]|uniref:Uncharacterized protein n=1 Tax=Mycobacterium branderi TaxID=43348 RepID=A0ABM7KKE0_9MYCO|nr:hypothetical protein MBRA_17080 [Mycobacterium branderi]
MSGGTAVFCAGAAIVAVLYGRYLLTALLVGATTLCVIPFVQWLYIARFVPRAMADSSGTTLRLDRRLDVLSAVLMLDAAVDLGSWAVLGHLHIVTVPFPEELHRDYLIMFGGPAVVCAVLVWLMIKRRGGGYVRLTPEGFVFAEGLVAKRGTWSDVTAVTDVAPKRSYGWGPFKLTFSHAYALCPITIAMANGKLMTVKQAGLYATDGDALREVVRFYWQHPGYRVELTDGRALQRLRDAQFEA